MKWHRSAQNPQSLENLYETVPDLKNIELFSINLDREAARLQIRFDLPVFPENPPKKWHRDVNTVQVQISFWQIKSFQARGWQTRMKVGIDIKKRDHDLEIVIAAPEIDLRYSFLCEFFRIESISPYQNEGGIEV